MTPRKDKAPETPLQSEEAKRAVINRSGAGGLTAVGAERARLAAEEADEDTSDRPRGSEIPIVGGDPKADFPAHDAPEARGAQAEPSQFTTNGSLPVGHVASPSGLVPVSAVTTDPTKGAELVQANLDATEKQLLRSGFEKLSRNKIESMDAATLRAVASDRGYDIGDYAGQRATRARFIAAQNKDEGLNEAAAGETAAATETNTPA
jgi:hypothetical protein